MNGYELEIIRLKSAIERSQRRRESLAWKIDQLARERRMEIHFLESEIRRASGGLPPNDLHVVIGNLTRIVRNGPSEPVASYIEEALQLGKVKKDLVGFARALGVECYLTAC